jgi:hypothetical protein
MIQTGFKAITNFGDVILSKILPPFFKNNLEKFAGSTEYRRLFITIATVIVYFICLALYELGSNNPVGSRPQDYVATVAPELLAFAPYVFSQWFVVGGLTLSLGGFLICIWFFETIELSFILTAGVYLVSFPMLFAKFYFSLSFPSSALNVYTFNILLNSFFTLLNLLGNAKGSKESQGFRFSYSFYIFLGILCLLPSFAFGGFLMYCGKFISS